MPVTLTRRPEIDHHTMKLIVGIIALSLGPLTSSLSGGKTLTSISESYYMGEWPRAIFIGFLFAISAFLLSYNGKTTGEMVASKLAALAGLGIALFPCGCGHEAELIPHVHYVSAAVMFAILAYLCYSFYRTAIEKHHREAKVRAVIYLACAASIVLAIAVLAANALTNDSLVHSDPRLVFHGEYAALLAFAISWLTASRVIPLLTRSDERISVSWRAQRPQ